MMAKLCVSMSAYHSFVFRNIVIESDILIENQAINNEFFHQEPEENNMRPKTNSNQESISTSWKYVLCAIILILAVTSLGVFIGYMLASD